MFHVDLSSWYDDFQIGNSARLIACSSLVASAAIRAARQSRDH